MDVEESELGSFEVWDRLPHLERPEPTRSRDNAISKEAWKSLFNDEGVPRISFAELKSLVFQQGFGKGKERMTGTHWDQLDPRAECWSFLLGAQEWSTKSGREERRRLWNVKAEEYWATKTQYLKNITEDGGNDDEEREKGGASRESSFWREQRHRVHVDCLRVDRRLPFFQDDEGNTGLIGGGEMGDTDDSQRVNAHAQRLEEILLSYVAWDRASEASQQQDGSNASERGLLGGYVQGMSDLCAPLYAVCRGDEAKTFWLLVGVMRRARHNFYSDQSGMKMQLLCLQKLISVMDSSLHAHLEKTDGLNLFFCFRWLLVCFKREFEFPDILMLWEAIWAAELDDEAAFDTKYEDQDGRSVTERTGLSNHFQIFVALAILEQQRDVVIKYLQHFDEILQVCFVLYDVVVRKG